MCRTYRRTATAAAVPIRAERHGACVRMAAVHNPASHDTAHTDDGRRPHKTVSHGRARARRRRAAARRVPASRAVGGVRPPAACWGSFGGRSTGRVGVLAVLLVARYYYYYHAGPRGQCLCATASIEPELLCGAVLGLLDGPPTPPCMRNGTKWPGAFVRDELLVLAAPGVSTWRGRGLAVRLGGWARARSHSGFFTPPRPPCLARDPRGDDGELNTNPPTRPRRFSSKHPPRPKPKGQGQRPANQDTRVPGQRAHGFSAHRAEYPRVLKFAYSRAPPRAPT